MANLTITVDEDLLRRARIRALEHGTSVNAVLRDYLAAWAADPDAQRVTDEILDASLRSTSGRGGRRWTRDDLHER
ncbi:MAG: hypothetical protein H6735_12195 [Alphaproteobacteria bacterium]|nr:hypothetical protein [Alphaproteobacteria bacterium]